MFNKKEKQFNELMDAAEELAEIGKNESKVGVWASHGQFPSQLGMILSATTPESWIAAVKAALETLASKLFGNSDRPKWTKIAASIVDIAAFVVAMIKSLKAMKK